ncbi:hypothetical protein Cgig2_012163 [Carnegiea gigantea]|uniref:Uncharacterized protein n=1 Tax=Carnegiea gigantea TaxID=171969 RepID=A0A9Q1KRS6_9CARY|nr:hypothetical protein Cgig2_012163 [Carnegiea gigantea]
MVSLSHPKSPLCLHIFSNMSKPSSSSSSSCLTTMKLKTLIQNLFFSHICRVARAISKAKTLLLDIFREKSRNKYRKKILFGSFRLHYNWCSSSHVLPILSPNHNSITSTTLEGKNVQSYGYYDSTWNSAFSTDEYLYNKVEEDQQEGLSNYLQWLEENNCNKNVKSVNSNVDEGDDENEIDKLADMFIASCHEKFRLEKIESYRRFQALLARRCQGAIICYS